MRPVILLEKLYRHDQIGKSSKNYVIKRNPQCYQYLTCKQTCAEARTHSMTLPQLSNIIGQLWIATNVGLCKPSTFYLVSLLFDLHGNLPYTGRSILSAKDNAQLSPCWQENYIACKIQRFLTLDLRKYKFHLY